MHSKHFPSACTLGPQVVTDGCDAVRAAMEAGLLPVLHGDAVLDEELGCTILGGDPLVARLCQAFRPDCCVFLVGVWVAISDAWWMSRRGFHVPTGMGHGIAVVAGQVLGQSNGAVSCKARKDSVDANRGPVLRASAPLWQNGPCMAHWPLPARLAIMFGTSTAGDACNFAVNACMCLLPLHCCRPPSPAFSAGRLASLVLSSSPAFKCAQMVAGLPPAATAAAC
jgi:hypothetical protein